MSWRRRNRLADGIDDGILIESEEVLKKKQLTFEVFSDPSGSPDVPLRHTWRRREAQPCNLLPDLHDDLQTEHVRTRREFGSWSG